VIEGGQDLRLSAKAADPLGVLGQRRGQNLYRHVADELRVTRAEHFAHAARTYGGGDFVRAEAISRRQHQGNFRAGGRAPGTPSATMIDADS